MHAYRAFGLEIHSNIALPELRAEAPRRPDVHIRYGRPPLALAGPKTVGHKYEARPEQLLIKTDKIARLLIAAGSQMTIQPKPGARDYQLRLLLMGWGMGALLQQRNTVALHGSVLCRGDEGFVICAPSGAGKSTLTAAFIQRGLSYLDDNLAVFSTEAAEPVVWPGYPQIKLWEDAFAKLNLEKPAHAPLFPHVPKFPVAFASSFCPQPALIRTIYLLSRSGQAHPALTPLTGQAKFKALFAQIFCRQFIADLSQRRPLLARLAGIAQRTRVVAVALPQHGWATYDLADLIEKDFAFALGEKAAK